MHETAIAQGLFDAIEKEAKKQKTKPLSVKMTCGLLSAVNDEVLQFAFDAICKGTICEATKLNIDHKPLQRQCKKCGKDFDIDKVVEQTKKLNPGIEIFQVSAKTGQCFQHWCNWFMDSVSQLRS